MNNIAHINDCYGCGVCAISCPHKLIAIELNTDGFYKPVISDLNNCTECGLCLKVCSYANIEVSQRDKGKEIDCYASWSNCESNRYNCSSGGLGYELGIFFIDKGYKACGVKYNIKQKGAEHFITDNIKSFQQTIGSKYIQSYTLSAFSKLTQKDKYIVFGTPCQIDSIRRYIQMKRIESNFILVDFFCHGVPSHLMWNKYLKTLKKKDKRIIDISWRNKNAGWHDSWAMNIGYTNSLNKLSFWSNGDLFYKMFLSDICLGVSCYERCKYKGIDSAADIRIGDLWGKKYKNDEKGVSGVLAITDIGKNCIKSLGREITLVPEDVATIVEGQMKKSPPKPLSYNVVMKLLKTNTPLKYIYITHYIISKIQKIKLIVFK